MKERWGMVGFPFYNTLSLAKPRSGTKTAKYAV